MVQTGSGERNRESIEKSPKPSPSDEAPQQSLGRREACCPVEVVAEAPSHKGPTEFETF